MHPAELGSLHLAEQPHGRYREFTHGLTRIGVWRLEATGFSLPDAVHVTICVTA